MSDIVEKLRKFASKTDEHSGTQMAEIKEDLAFAGGHQYSKKDDELRGEGRAKMTFNLLRQYANQIINAYRKYPFGVVFSPRRKELEAKTKVTNAIFKNWAGSHGWKENTTLAVDRQVKCGVGYCALTTDYLDPSKGWEQDINMVAFPRPDLVIYGMCKDPTGKDVREVAVIEHISIGEAQERYGDEYDWENMNRPLEGTKWCAPEGMVEIVKYFVLDKKGKKVYRSEDGQDLPYEGKVTKQKNKPSKIRDTYTTSVKCYTICGDVELDSTELPLSRIPVIRFAGELIDLESGKQTYKGITYFAKSVCQLINWSGSLIAELISISPKTTRYADGKSISSYKEIWQNANRLNTPYLPWDSFDEDGNKYAPPTDSNPAVNISDKMSAQANYQGLLSAMMGMPEAGATTQKGLQETATEVLTKNKSAEVANFQFPDNASFACKELGLVWLELANITWDTARATTIEIDGKEVSGDIAFATDINLLPSDTEVNVESGPLQATEKQESLNSMIALGAILGPEASLVMADSIVKSTEFAESEEIANRLKQLAIAKTGIGDDGAQDPQAVEALTKAQQTIELLQAEKEEALAQKQGIIDQMQMYIGQMQIEKQTAEIDAKAKIITQQMADDTKIYLKQMEIYAKDVETMRKLEAEFETAQLSARTELQKLYASGPQIIVGEGQRPLNAVGGMRNTVFRA